MGKQRRATAHPDQSLRYLRALGDADRLKIVQALRDGPKSVGDICKDLASPMANVSHHLHALKDAGIVSASKRGRFVIYRLNHVGESRRSGTHVLDFGCVRIEFGEGQSVPSVTATRPEAEALMILNRMLDKPSITKPTRRRAKWVPPKKNGAGTSIEIVNPSFEEPSTPFFDTQVAGWQKEGEPSGTGVFRNFPDDTPIPGSRFVQNADGEQLATIAARGSAGLFQLLAGTRYARGVTYTLTVGVGISSVQPPTSDTKGASPALRIALTYTDPAGRRREVAGRRLTPAKLRSNRLTSIAVTVTAERLPTSCIGRPIGILLTTDGNTAGHAGHFILDSVSLVTA